MAPAPSLGSGLSIVSAIAEYLTQPGEIGSGLMSQPSKLLSGLQPARRPNLKISNRESLRLEIDVTQTKQTTQPHSNREVEALFSSRVRADDSARSYIARAINRLRDCQSIDSTRGYIARSTLHTNPKISTRERRSSIRQNASSRLRKLPASPKNNTTHPSVLLRLKPTPVLCFVGVTDNFNRTMLRLNDPFSTPEIAAPMQIRRKKMAITATSTPPNLFRLETNSAFCFLRLTRNLNEPMFRLEIQKGGKKSQAQTRRMGHPETRRASARSRVLSARTTSV
jgi:hypothetical protein